MTDAQFVGCGAETPLAKERVVRVTFTHIWAGVPFLFVGSDFPPQFAPVWDAIASSGAFPMTPNNATDASPFATVDCKVTVAQTAGQLYQKLNALSWKISVSRFELLTVRQGQQAATQAGAGERNAVDATQQQQADDSGLSGWWKGLTAELQTSLRVLVWVLVAIAAVVALYWAGKFRNVLKR
jgi:hypothetical protein